MKKLCITALLLVALVNQSCQNEPIDSDEILLNEENIYENLGFEDYKEYRYKGFIYNKDKVDKYQELSQLLERENRITVQVRDINLLENYYKSTKNTDETEEDNLPKDNIIYLFYSNLEANSFIDNYQGKIKLMREKYNKMRGTCHIYYNMVLRIYEHSNYSGKSHIFPDISSYYEYTQRRKIPSDLNNKVSSYKATWYEVPDKKYWWKPRIRLHDGSNYNGDQATHYLAHLHKCEKFYSELPYVGNLINDKASSLTVFVSK